MIAEYKFRYDEAYVVDGLKHYRRQHHSRRWLWLLKLVGYLGLGLLAAIGVFAKSVPMTLIFVFFLVLLAAGPLFDYWWVRKQFRKSPFFNSDVVVRFSNAGYFGQDANGHSELSWRAFIKGFRFTDGVLLFTAPQHFHWFPDAALVSGTAAEVNSLLKAKLSKYYGAEQNSPADAQNARG